MDVGVTLQSPFLLAVINFAASGNNTVVAGVPANRIFIYRVTLMVATATAITFQDGAAAMTGAFPFAASEGMVLDYTFSGMPAWFKPGGLTPGNPFIINNSNAVQVSGHVEYIISPIVP